jgi:hypothetical protein
MKCHFVYSVPMHMDRSLSARIVRKIRTLLNNREYLSAYFQIGSLQSMTSNRSQYNPI